jgi:hypothetical protein
MQTTEKMMKTMLTRWFFSRGFVRLLPSYVPVVSTAHLVVRQLIGLTRQARTSVNARTYLTSEGSSITRSTRVALRDPRGVSTIPLTNPPLEHHTSFSCASTESQAIKSSRRWSNKHHRLATRSPSATRCNLMMQHTRIALTHNRIVLLQAQVS